MQSRPVNLNQMIESQMETRGVWAANQIEVRTMYGDNLPLIAGDAELLQQIVHNLVTNAREAMPEGGCLTLRTAALMVDAAYARRHEEARPGAFVCLQVSDTGCGMSAEVQARLFEPFFTTKKTSKSAGLGLASVYGLVKQHGGWIEVSSQPGSGTTMTVFFPCGPSASAPKKEGGEVCETEAGAADGTVVAVG
jgi:signal transduction histidine kinase